MSLPSLSGIVRGFMTKWLLIPSIAGIICSCGVWIYIETREMKQQQQYYARTVSDHVTFYLMECNNDLNYSAGQVQKNNASPVRFLTFIRNKFQFRATYILDAQGKVIHSVPRDADTKDFSGLINLPVPQGTFVLTAP